jgi:hypothetical protein
MAINQSTVTTDLIRTPSLLASTMIDALESTDTQEVSIVDPFNGFVIQMMSMCHIFSKLNEEIDDRLSYLYKNRARTAKHLLTHLSEFTYSKVMGKPATVPFALKMSSDWLRKNSVQYDENYNMLEIPAESYIEMSGTRFATYYPIQFLINRNTDALSATYRLDDTHPLYTLESNALLRSYTEVKDGIEWFLISFNMFQYAMDVQTFNASSNQGFAKTLTYTDKFYAIRVMHRLDSGLWSEMTISLSTMNYDRTVPTAIISLDPDNNQIGIKIPLVYFTTGLLRNSIKVMIYTTKGAINYSVNMTDLQSIAAHWVTSDSVYSAPMEKMPSWGLLPVSEVISGGSDPMTYAELRDAVVNNRLSDAVAITMAQLEQKAIAAGFEAITREADNVTDRLYFVWKTLRDSSDMIIPTLSGSILLDADTLDGDPETIINFDDGYHTILPTTVYKLPGESTVCTPLTTAEANNFKTMSKQEIVDELNKGNYVRQPFHIVLQEDPRSPTAKIYHMMSPTFTNLVFKDENAHSAPQMSAIAGALVHRANGTGGFLLNLHVERSANIVDLDASLLSVVLTVIDTKGEKYYLPLTCASSTDGDDVWQAILGTNYRITSENTIILVMYDENDTESSAVINMNQEFKLIYSFKTSYDSTIPKDATLNALLPTTLKTPSTAMCYQTVMMEFGKDLTDQLYTGVNVTWGSDVYQTATENVYHKATAPIYQYDESGIIYTDSDPLGYGSLKVCLMYEAGDTPPDTGDIVTKTARNIAVPSSGTTTVIEVVDATGFLIGMPVRGLNIPTNATVQTKNGNLITINKVITAAIPAGSVITGSNSQVMVRTSAVQSAISRTIPMAHTTGIYPGMTAHCIDFNRGTTVVSVTGSSVTVSADPKAVLPAGRLITFVNATAHGVIKIAKGDVLLGVDGKALIESYARNKYRIPAILFDGRIFASESPEDTALVSSIHDTISTHADQIATIDENMREVCSTFYRPYRTMGYSSFAKGNSQYLTLPLTVGFSVTLYVDESTYNNEDARDLMEQTIITTINDAVDDDYIDIQRIGKAIDDAVSDDSTRVEMGGINNDPSLRFLALNEKGTGTSVGQVLKLLDDGTIDRVPDITITFIQKP